MQFLQLRREAWKIQDFNGVWTRDLAMNQIWTADVKSNEAMIFTVMNAIFTIA